MPGALRALQYAMLLIWTIAGTSLATPACAAENLDLPLEAVAAASGDDLKMFLAMKGVAKQTLGGACERDKDCNTGRCTDNRCVCTQDTHCPAPSRCQISPGLPHRCAP